jgi:hypothetical protein
LADKKLTLTMSQIKSMRLAEWKMMEQTTGVSISELTTFVDRGIFSVDMIIGFAWVFGRRENPDYTQEQASWDYGLEDVAMENDVPPTPSETENAVAVS